MYLAPWSLCTRKPDESYRRRLVLVVRISSALCVDLFFVFVFFCVCFLFFG